LWIWLEHRRLGRGNLQGASVDGDLVVLPCGKLKTEGRFHVQTSGTVLVSTLSRIGGGLKVYAKGTFVADYSGYTLVCGDIVLSNFSKAIFSLDGDLEVKDLRVGHAREDKGKGQLGQCFRRKAWHIDFPRLPMDAWWITLK
jgi:hypothetical protein